MKQLKNILVGLDFEDGHWTLTAGSRAAAKEALWLAGRTGGRVDFLHSTWTDAEDGGALPRTPDEAARSEVELLARELGPDVPTSDLLVSDERPWIALTRRVLEGHADLVVVAKRSHLRRDERRLGSVSTRLVRKCPGAVWVVRPDHERRHRSIVAATDLTPVGDLATEYGAFVAEADECALWIVHAWQVPMELQLSASRLGVQETARRKREITDAARAHVRGVPAVAELGDRVEVVIACDAPSHAILQLVAEKDPDLVVMGTISRTGLAGLITGNTAEKLLSRLDASLLTVKPADFESPLRL